MLHQVGLNEGTLEKNGFVFETVDGKNIIRLAADVGVDDVRFNRAGGNAITVIIKENASVTFLGGPDVHDEVDAVVFRDGSEVDTRGSLYLNGTEGNDRLETTYGFHDTIEGFGGNDYMRNNLDGISTFVIGRNDGNDTITGWPGEIRLTDGITQDDLRFVFASFDTIKMFINETSSVLFGYDYQGRTSSIKLEDGSAVSIQTLIGIEGDDKLFVPDNGNGSSFTLKGLGGNDTIIIDAYGDNTLIGGAGNDSMSGGGIGSHGDTYIIGLNEGHDTVYNHEGNPNNLSKSTIAFGEGIHLEDLTYEGINTSRYGYDVIIHIGEISSVTIKDLEEGYAFPKLQFADGTMLDLKDAGIKFYFPKEGTAGNDLITGTEFHDLFTGLGGNDTITGLKGNDTLNGGAGNDSLNGGFNNDSLVGGDGNDTLLGGDQDDRMQGDAGNDFLNGQGGKDFILGGEGNDTLLGEGFNDTLFGGNGDDSLDGGQQDDLLYGGAGNDTLEGWVGNDTIYGEEGNDLIRGNRGADSIDAGAGNDTINGGIGGDTLTGGAGADRFVYTATSDSFNKIAGGADTITDFEHGVDLLILTGLKFTGLDTDGGLTEKGELRLSYDAPLNITHIHSDQTGFDVALSGNYANVITNSDFVF